MDLFGARRLAVVSPHLDDAALSLGATIARTTGSGGAATVVTVLSGDPESPAPASAWDLSCGFSSSAEAARARRLEDAKACEILGAEPVWLPFGDQEHDRGGTDDEVWAALGPHLQGSDLVLVPGHPLVHADHKWLTRLVLDRGTGARIALYVEQPYASNITVGRGYSLRPLIGVARLAASTRLSGRPFMPTTPASIEQHVAGVINWQSVRPTRAERRMKNESIRAYVSQFGLDRLGRRLLTRIRLFESATGGEHVGLVGPSAGR